MKLASRGSAIALHVLALTVGPSGIASQEGCPRASGPAAEGGWAAYADGDMERARERFGSALARCPDDLYARTGLGYVRLRLADVPGATALWSDVVALDPNNVDALTGLGLAAWRTGELEAARDRFTRVLALVPDHPTATEYVARIERGSDAVPERDAADDAWERGDAELALELYERRRSASSDDPVASLRVALIRSWQGEYDAGRTILDSLLTRDATNMDARLARARVRAWSGDLSGARSDALDVLAVEPDRAEALEALASFQAWAGDFEESLETHDLLNAITPERRSAGRGRAQTLAWAGDFRAATSAYQALVARNPDDLEAWLGLAQVMAYAEDFDGAISQYDWILTGWPGEIRALTGKARALGGAERLVEAEQVAVEAVSTDRASAAAWAGLGEIYRWQGRAADAWDALNTAAELAPTSPGVADQLRSVDLMLSPVAVPSVVHERDSDENRMTTTSVSAGWHTVSRLEIRGSAYHRRLEQGILTRTARGVSLLGSYELRPGWLVSAGIGGSRTDGLDDPSFLEAQFAVRSPGRYAYGGAMSVSTSGLNETAALAQRGVRSSQILLAARWSPVRRWQIDGGLGLGRLTGTEPNGRRSVSLSASRAVGRTLNLGAGIRAFSFQKDLDDGYFDPEFYGVAELTGRWLYRAGSWSLLAELAPGLERVGTDGETDPSLRGNVRTAYQLGPAREISLAFGYTSAGLMSFATGRPGYRYTAFVLGSRWTF